MGGNVANDKSAAAPVKDRGLVRRFRLFIITTSVPVNRSWLQINQKSPHLQINEGERVITPGGRFNGLLAALILFVLLVPWVIGAICLLRWIL